MKKFVLILSVLLIVQVETVCAMTLQDKALSFVEGAQLPDEARKILLECISKDSKKSEWLAESQTSIYSLQAIQVPKVKGGNNFAQNTTEKNSMKRAELKAIISLTALCLLVLAWAKNFR